jgi:sec-independent protein translocase protein TatB
MFDIGWSELLVIAVVAIVVVGPRELPKLMRTFGYYAGKLRRAAAEFRRQFDDAMREAELDEVKKAIESVKTETASIETSVREAQAPLDKRFMPPELEEKPLPPPPDEAKQAAIEAKPATEVKPAAKAPRKRAAAKAKTPAKRAKSGAEPAP